MELKPELYESVMNLTRSDEDEEQLAQALHHYLDNPFINKLQVFSNQAVSALVLKITPKLLLPPSGVIPHSWPWAWAVLR